MQRNANGNAHTCLLVQRRRVWAVLVVMIALMPSRLVNAIGCYKCSTTNNDESCKDPFNPGATNSSLYEKECETGIDQRIGLFPARYCLKVSGYIGKIISKIIFFEFGLQTGLMFPPFCCCCCCYSRLNGANSDSYVHSDQTARLGQFTH